MKSLKQNLSLICSLLLLIGAIYISVNSIPVKAALGLSLDSTNKNLAAGNPYRGNVLATTTTTLFYMTAGTATTTLSEYTANINDIAFNILFNASSSSSILKWRYEFSSNAVDWYSDDFQLNQTGTSSTPYVAVPTFTEYSWTFASSTGGTATSSASLKHINLLNITSPYTRIVLYIPPGAAAGAINVQAILKTTNPI